MHQPIVPTIWRIFYYIFILLYYFTIIVGNSDEIETFFFFRYLGFSKLCIKFVQGVHFYPQNNLQIFIILKKVCQYLNSTVYIFFFLQIM